MAEDNEKLLTKKLEEIYSRVRQRYPSGAIAAEALEYYEEAQSVHGEAKLYYMRLLASIIDEA